MLTGGRVEGMRPGQTLVDYFLVIIRSRIKRRLFMSGRSFFFFFCPCLEL